MSSRGVLAERKLKDREKKVSDKLNSTHTVDLLPLALSAVKRMRPNQQNIARHLTLEQLARVDLLHREMYGY